MAPRAGSVATHLLVAVSVLVATACTGTAVAGYRAGTAASDDAAGRTIFIDAGCGACHALRDAGTTGIVGPNLDRITPPERHVAQFVLDGGVGMPSFSGILTPEQVEAVARYVETASGF